MKDDMQYLPLERIRTELFSDKTNAANIRKSYQIEEGVVGPALEAKVLSVLAQTQRDPLSAAWSNDEMFQQAVKGIGSNSRSWAAFLSGAGGLERELLKFEVNRINAALAQGTSAFEDYTKRIKPYLSGLTSTSDARAILRIAQRLAQLPDYYDKLRQAFAFFASKLDRANAIFDAQVTIAVAMLLANRDYDRFARSSLGKSYKLPGMGISLASEFLRNLGWTGFKPDRHVTEMLGKWYPIEEQAALVGKEVEVIRRIFGRVSSADARAVRISLLGAKMTPPGSAINQSDRLVWLYRSMLGKWAL